MQSTPSYNVRTAPRGKTSKRKRAPTDNEAANTPKLARASKNKKTIIHVWTCSEICLRGNANSANGADGLSAENCTSPIRANSANSLSTDNSTVCATVCTNRLSDDASTVPANSLSGDAHRNSAK